MGVQTSKFDPEEKIWSGPKVASFYSRDISIGQVLHKSIAQHPKNVLQINDTEAKTMTNAEVLTMSTKIALGLLDLGIKQTDFIGIMASNTSYSMPVCFASLFVATPFHPVDVTFTKEAIIHAWSKTKPKVFFCDGSVYNIVKEVAIELGLTGPIYTLNDHLEGVKKVTDLCVDYGMKEKMFQPSYIPTGDQTAVILCSSGSTGLSKAVTLSHRYLTTLIGKL